MNNYSTNSYLFETYDEFISRKVKEDQKHYDVGYEDGYETALYSVLEMIEEDASYEEVYESICEYLEEATRYTKEYYKKMGASKGTIAALNRDPLMGKVTGTLRRSSKWNDFNDLKTDIPSNSFVAGRPPTYRAEKYRKKIIDKYKK